jgi:hypothetical protein
MFGGDVGVSELGRCALGAAGGAPGIVVGAEAVFGGGGSLRLHEPAATIRQHASVMMVPLRWRMVSPSLVRSGVRDIQHLPGVDEIGVLDRVLVE